jgi:hypothetical protein
MPKIQIELDTDELELIEVFQEFSDAIFGSIVFKIGDYAICVVPESKLVYLVLPLKEGFQGNLNFKWGCYSLPTSTLSKTENA